MESQRVYTTVTPAETGAGDLIAELETGHEVFDIVTREHLDIITIGPALIMHPVQQILAVLKPFLAKCEVQPAIAL